MIIEEMTEDAYNALEGVRASWLKQLWSSTPAHLRERMNAEDDDSEALRIGRALHMAVLQPERFADNFIRVPKVDRRTKAGKEEWAALAASAGLRTMLPDDEHGLVDRMAAAVRGTSASTLLDFCAYRETVLTGEVFGVPAKCRIDAFDSETGLLIDLKSCISASPRAFQRSIVDYGYHLQMAFYRELMRQNGIEQLEGGGTVLIAVEKQAPNAVALYAIKDEDIDRAAALLPELVALYDQCRKTDQWPAYPTTVVSMRLPDYAFNKTEVTDE